MRVLKAFLLAALALVPLATPAAEPRRLAHYAHQRWIEGSEAPVPVLAMAQGRDGFLWLATGDGLFRFDGVRFEAIALDGDARGNDLPSTVLATRSGDVWTNFETSRRFAVYRHGALRLLDAPPAPSRIVEMAEGADGAIWALTANFNATALRFHDGRWTTFDAADGLPQSNAANLLVAADGAVWIACSTGIARLAPGASRFALYRATPPGRLSQDPAGRIWFSGSDGSYPVTGPGGRGPAPALRAPYRSGEGQLQGAPLFDHEGNLWFATRYDGVRRLAAPTASLAAGGDDTAEPESFGSRDGLSSDVTNQVLEDREGNLWVGTEGGLDKFRPATLIADPALGSPATFGDKLLAASDGSVWIGQARTLYRARPGQPPEPVLRDIEEPQSLCEAPDGAIWVGFATHVAVWADGRIRDTIERPDRGASHNLIYDCAFDADGHYWISAAGGGVHRYGDGRWQAMLPAGDRPDFYPTSMVRTPRGGVAVQAGDKLVWFERSGRSTTPLDFGGSGIKVLTLHTDGDDVFAAGAFGLSRLRDGRVETIPAAEVGPGSRINGMVRTPAGDTWLAYPKALMRFGPKAFERAFHDRKLPAPALSLGLGDGLKSRPHSHSQQSMVRGGDGRLWIATETGTLWMDPARIVRNGVPPIVAIRSITADGRVRRDPGALQLPAATANVEIDFAVLSFADPGRVRARYRLEGFDRGWVDPGARREAFYTNLPPGTYRFRVAGANNDGVWDEAGATLAFTIPPTFVQSTWFVLLCCALGLALLWVVYRLRVARLARRIRNRLDERVKERERIARELHDTLLQGVQGLVLRFQAVAERIPGGDKSREQLEAALAAADDVMVDARNRVRDLRGEGADDLSASIEGLVAAAPFDPPIPVRIVVEGKPRRLHPLVAAEVTRIVREALFNIAHHARATSAEVAIGFEARHLAIRIRDDGVGIPEDVLARGHKDGHYGMVGMRERAEKIGGAITITSMPSGGTEVTLALPTRLAFARRGPRRPAWWPRFLRGGSSDG
ncbi:MAG TPA: two-component regulator propeller domain-containing protein [Luteimonas sp.]|nr:two-component regulator propeller domain-containing protein [Luteimonas sp.]